MKKLPVIIALGLFCSLVFNSCKKDYTCTCTVTSIIADTSLTFVTSIKDSKKKMAEAECDGSQEAYSQIGALLVGTATCELDEK
jgi:hypothetical protein